MCDANGRNYEWTRSRKKEQVQHIVNSWNAVRPPVSGAPFRLACFSAKQEPTTPRAEAVAREAADLLAEMDAAWPPSQPPPHPKSFQGRFQARVRAVAHALREKGAR